MEPQLYLLHANAVSGYDHQMNISTLAKLTEGDYIELMVFQTSGGSLNVNFADQNSPDFSMVKVG